MDALSTTNNYGGDRLPVNDSSSTGINNSPHIVASLTGTGTTSSILTSLAGKPIWNKKIQELNLAHTCGVLMYSRDKVCINIAKKLKPEFGKFYLGSEVKDCIKLIEKFNKSLDNIGIDIVIIDSDPISAKLIEFVNNRAKSPEYSNFPIISTLAIIVDPEDTADFLPILDSVGGIQMAIQSPFDTKFVMNTLLQMIYRVKTVDNVYRELRSTASVQQGTAAYPYIPIFDSNFKKAMMGPDDGITVFDGNDDDSDDEGDGQGSKKLRDEQSMGSLAVSEMDLWSDCSSILTNDVHEARRAILQQQQQQQEQQQQQHGLFPVEIGTAISMGQLSPEVRKDVDKLLLKASNIESSTSMLNTSQLYNAIINATDRSAGAGAGTGSGTGIGKGGAGAISSDAFRASTNGATSSTVKSFAQHAAESTAAAVIIQPQYRPIDKSQNIQAHSSRGDRSLDGEGSRGTNNSSSIIVEAVEIGPFVHRHAPHVSSSLTVLGLDKRVATKHWRVLTSNRRIDDTANFRKMVSLSEIDTMSRRSGRQEESPVPPRFPASILIANSSSRERFPAPTRTESSVIDNMESYRPRTSSGTGQAAAIEINNGRNATSLPKVKSSHKLANVGESPKATLRQLQKQAGKKVVMADLLDAALSSAKLFETYSLKVSEDTLARLAGLQTPDVQMEQIMEVDIKTRKMNRGERDLLLSGRHAEEEGDADGRSTAEAIYRRAYTKSHNAKSPDCHIARLYLAALKYRTGDFIAALKLYDVALAEMEHRSTNSLGSHKRDCFVAYFNRALVLLRLGNDHMAAQDFQQALYFEPDNTEALRIQAILYRRMGRYEQAIEVQTSVKTLQREEQLRKEIEAVEKAKKIKLLGLPTSTKRAGFGGGSSSSASQTTGTGSFNDPLQLQQAAMDAVTDQGIYIPVPEFHGSCKSIQERKRNATAEKTTVKGGKADGDTGDARQDIMSNGLHSFKQHNGFTDSLFDDLFIQTSELQKALIVAPGRRSDKDIEVICTNLRLIPFFRSLDDSQFSELSANIEYRAISSSINLFDQDKRCDLAVVMLRGSSTVLLDGPSAATKNMVIGDLKPGEVFGHIDLLMQHPRCAVYQELRRYLKEEEEDNEDGLFHDQSLLSGPHATGGVSREDSFSEEDSSIVSGMEEELIPGQSQTSRYLDDDLLDGKYREGDRRPTNERYLDNNNNNSGGDGIAGGSNLKVLTGRAPEHLLDDSRAMNPNSFATYEISSMSELLLIPSLLFQNTCLRRAEDDFRNRFNVVKACGIFSTWSKQDLVRLARMAQVRTVKAGQIILRQKEKPTFLYIVLKGMCKVFKRPNQSEILERKLVDMKARAEKHDFKYIYHHGLRGVLSKGDIKQTLYQHTNAPSHVDTIGTSFSSLGLGGSKPSSPAASAAGGGGGGTHAHSPSRQNSSRNALSRTVSSGSMGGYPAEADYRPNSPPSPTHNQHLTPAIFRHSSNKNFHPTASSIIQDVNILSFTNATLPEVTRVELELEIRRLEALLAKVHLHEAKLYEDADNEFSMRIDKDETYCEIATLDWPKLFGESSVLDPVNGLSRGAVMADTECELLLIHKTQLQTFRVSSTMLDRLKVRSVLYPNDEVLVENMEKKGHWMHYRESVMKKIRKDRWPKPVSDLDPFAI